MKTLSLHAFTRKLPLILAGLFLPALPLVALAEEAPAPEEKPLDVRLHLNQGKLVRGEEQEIVVKIDLVGGKPKRGGVRLPLNVAVVLDRSGSMEGEKMEQAKQAANMLIDRLEVDDYFSLVTYESEVEVNISATKVGDNAEKWQRHVRRLETGGSTALYAGVEAGGEEVREYLKDNHINRVILLSDGLANVGKKSPREITRLGKDLAEAGIAVTTIGLGEDFNEDLMTALAEASDANYYYVEDVEKLPEVFAKELGQLNNIVARDVEIRIILPEGVTPVEIMGRNEKFRGREATVRLSHFNAAQKREILVKAKLTPGAEAKDLELAKVSTRYLDELDAGKEASLDAAVTAEVTEDKKLAEASRDAEVVTRVQQMETDKAKTEAANLAQAGRKDEAKAVLEMQMSDNAAVAATLPAPAAQSMSAENEGMQRLGTAVREQEGKDLAGSVKRAKADSWKRQNAKE